MAASSLLSLAGFILANFLAATSGAFFRPGSWYAGLRKPSWTPPDLAFPVVWTILYSLNAISGWMILGAAGEEAGTALAIYGVSLIINAGWSAVFFGQRSLRGGMLVVILLWLSIVAVILAFLPFDLTAALMQLPYLLWVTVAAALNLRILQLNPAAGR